MTYNFDPDRWLENQRRALEGRRDRGELDDGAFPEAWDDLDRRYEELVARLDGTFEIPKRRSE